jgi:SAM-dependent methyltransferase
LIDKTWKYLVTSVVIIAGLLFAGAFLTGVPQQASQDATAVQPGINDFWKGSDIDPLIDRLETESREIYRQRQNLAALVGPLRGTAVADVGAGSGFMVEEFARLVGSEGKVYAVDINPSMLDAIVQKAEQEGLSNIEKILCPEDSVNLPPRSVDLVFICDTYHHLPYPKATMASIHRALRPGGQLVLVDFRRVAGESSEWLLEHVRAGEDVFRQEILEAGFKLINAHYPPFLEQNYVLRFQKQEPVQ